MKKYRLSEEKSFILRQAVFILIYMIFVFLYRIWQYK